MSLEIRGAYPEERTEISRIVNLAFEKELCAPGSVGWSDDDPHNRVENTRILRIAGEIVSVVHVGEREAHACGHRVPIGFLSAICTHPNYRGRGYMRRVLRDAEDYMRKRGFCYGMLFGSFGMYGRSLGWRGAREKEEQLGGKQSVRTTSMPKPGLSVRCATPVDASFLARVYETRYSNLLGPIARSEEYWRRWSLTHDWEGAYWIICGGTTPVGYFHVSPEESSCDEVGWDSSDGELPADVFRAVASWALRRGKSQIDFWLNADDREARSEFGRVFGPVPEIPCKPNGQPAESDDPTPWLPDNCPDGVGYMVKFFNPAIGILAEVDCTDTLTAAMAQYHWTTFDGDWM